MINATEVNKLMLEDYIKRMLVYFDPMELIILGAPHDEYDQYVDKIRTLIFEKQLEIEALSFELFKLLDSDIENKDDLKRKSKRMAEDLAYLLRKVK
jgi:hypothetical protein